MELGQHLEQRQTQSLVITPPLRQLLRLVQMNNQELASHINEQLESNPLLERQSDPDETARIERWLDKASGNTHWRTISADNVTTVYGRSANARIADPAYSSA